MDVHHQILVYDLTHPQVKENLEGIDPKPSCEWIQPERRVNPFWGSLGLVATQIVYTWSYLKLLAVLALKYVWIMSKTVDPQSLHPSHICSLTHSPQQNSPLSYLSWSVFWSFITPQNYGPSHLHLFQRLLHGVHHCLVVCEEQEAALRLDEVLNLGWSFRIRFSQPQGGWWKAPSLLSL